MALNAPAILKISNNLIQIHQVIYCLAACFLREFSLIPDLNVELREWGLRFCWFMVYDV